MQSPPRKHGKNEIKKTIKNIISMKNNQKTPIKGTVIKISIPKQMLQTTNGICTSKSKLHI